MSDAAFVMLNRSELFDFFAEIAVTPITSEGWDEWIDKHDLLGEAE